MSFERVIKDFGVLKQTTHWTTHVRLVERGGERYLDIRKATNGHLTKQGIALTADMLRRFLAQAPEMLKALGTAEGSSQDRAQTRADHKEEASR